MCLRLAPHSMAAGRRTPDWAPIFAGYEWSRKWVEEEKPDVVILVYNDHASAFSLDIVPTFAIGCAESFAPGRRRLGAASRPGRSRSLQTGVAYRELRGAGRVRSHHHESDGRRSRAHGAAVLMLGQPAEWPVKVIPLAVNVIQYPTPTANRCFRLGEALARAVRSFPEDLNVQVWGTGGMSHQLSGKRAGLINREWDTLFLDRLTANPDALRTLSHEEYIREAGSEGMELIMWLTMRGALGPKIRELHRFYHVPASNTAVGHVVLTPEG